MLRAVFDLFDIRQLLLTEGALRHGALARPAFPIDEIQANRMSDMATALFAQIARVDAQNERCSPKAAWAARQHEIGTHISHERTDHHGAYILDHVNAPGLSLA